MKNTKKNIVDLIIIGLIMIGLFKSYAPIPEPEMEIEDCDVEILCMESDSCKSEPMRENFDYVYNRFKVYNRDIDTNTVNRFIDVADYYGFQKDSVLFRLAVGQILLESGANQYYYKGHPYEGRLVVSPANAIGMTQILPSTAYHFMTKIITPKDSSILKRFGVTDYSFAFRKDLSYRKKVALSREWLTNQDNNIALWGYIMRYNMKKCDKNIIKSLIAYNAGRGGLNLFISRGNSIWAHAYIKGIYSRLRRVDRKVSVI